MTSFSRNQKTNAFLGAISDLLTQDKDTPLAIPVTLVVDGMLITGELISAKEFFEIQSNTAFLPIYKIAIQEGESIYFNESGEIRDEYAEREDEIPDYLWQRFIYLKNARYISGGSFFPSVNNEGVSIQVRGNDISAFSLTSFTQQINA
ncbi:hypothetical protein D3C78_139310 [compost metagenome]